MNDSQIAATYFFNYISSGSVEVCLTDKEQEIYFSEIIEEMNDTIN